jgi:dTDP-4-amino-4,6-dideoxygalactose transaminase
MDSISGFAAEHDLVVIEDAAHALFGRYRGRPLGGIGDLGTLSFHETKNITCGEGGALLINRPGLAERAEIIREKGTNRSQFFRGEADRYTWVDLGSSYLLADPLAAALVAQLEDAERIQERRRAIWDRYASALAPWAASNGVQLPFVPEECEHPAHLFFLLFPTGESRDRCLDYLRACGILGVFHYLPLHISPMGRRFGGRPGQCPVTESVAGRLVRLPLYTDLAPTEREEVIDAVLKFSC